MSSQTQDRKLILVIGATGAQGLAVIDALVAPAADGSPSPYAVRALTRDPKSQRAGQLKQKGVEVVKGAFDDLPSVAGALKGVYGAFVNTDGFTVGEEKEIYAGIRIFELAKVAGNVRHYVWSNLDYSFKKGGYNPLYKCEHYDAKGRVADWMKAQPSIVSDTDMSWSVLTSGPYMDMLKVYMFGPMNERPDGTFVFASPIGKGHVPMIALADLGFFARYTFDHREEVSSKDLEVASEMVSWDRLVSAFTNVTGKKAVFKPVELDEWFTFFTNADRLPVANERAPGGGSTTWKQNFSGWWAMFRDDIIKRDMAWIKSVNPDGYDLERWMRENNYQGRWDTSLLKNVEDQKTVQLDVEKMRTL